MHVTVERPRRRALARAGHLLISAALAAGLAATAPPANAQVPVAQAAAPSASVPGIGPIDPNTGYPFWVTDDTGERMALCIDRAQPPTGLCLADLADKTTRPFVSESPAQTNLAPDPETFWSDASAAIDQGGNALYVAAKEATFGGADEAPRAGDQIAFGRVRIRVFDLIPGESYTVTHPYGRQTFVAEDRDGDPATPRDGVIRSTEDIGCMELPCDFREMLQSPVTSFLRWDPTVGPAAPEGYVGDPTVPHPVVGSPRGTNFFRVDGPDVGGPGVDRIETDLFSLQGQLWQPTEPMLGMLGHRNLVDFGRLDVPDLGGAPATQTVTLTNAGGGATPLQLQPVVLDGAGEFTIVSDSCSGAGLAPGATCDVEIQFAPVLAGPHAARLEIRSNGADAEPLQRILVRGVGRDGNDPRDLRATGPLSLQHGFPLWYRDENGLQLGLCEDPTDTRCLPAPGPYDPAAGPMSFPGNFPHEVFWWAAEAHTETNNGFEANLIMAQEAAFLNEGPGFGEQMAFGRIRLRIGGLTPGETYTVTTPYGVHELVAEESGKRGINITEDIGCLQGPCDYTRVNQSNVGPFLTWVDGAPEGYIGEPLVDSAVTPGPYGSVFRVQGPGVYAPEGDDSEAPPPADGCPTLDGHALSDCVEVDQFSLAGKLWKAPDSGLLALDDRFSTIELAPTGPGEVSAPRPLTLTNAGQAPVSVGAVALPDASPFTVVDDTCSGSTVAPGAECTLAVTLAPSAEADTGTVEDLLSVTSDDSTVPGRILLRGSVHTGTATTAAPSMPDLQAADDTGVSATDDVTAAETLTFSGAAASGRPVTVLVDGAPVGTADLQAAAWTLDTSLPEGTHVVTAAYDDGSTSAPLTVVVDRTAPASPGPATLDASSDTGTVGDNVTTDLTPTLNGAVPSGTAAVRVVVDGAAVGQVPVAVDGTWQYTLPPQEAGQRRVTVRAVDAAGNASVASGPLLLDLQLLAPSRPALAVGSNGGSASDNLTNDPTPVLVGTSQPGALVRILADGRPVGQARAAEDGTFAVTVSRLAHGRHTIVAQAVNGAGEALSRLSPPSTIRIDLRAPAVTRPRVRLLPRTRVRNRVTAVVRWSASESGSRVTELRLQRSRNGRRFVDVRLAGPRARAFRERVALRSRYRFRVRATDAAGNVSQWRGSPRMRVRLARR